MRQFNIQDEYALELKKIMNESDEGIDKLLENINNNKYNKNVFNLSASDFGKRFNFTQTSIKTIFSKQK